MKRLKPQRTTTRAGDIGGDKSGDVGPSKWSFAGRRHFPALRLARPATTRPGNAWRHSRPGPRIDRTIAFPGPHSHHAQRAGLHPRTLSAPPRPHCFLHVISPSIHRVTQQLWGVQVFALFRFLRSERYPSINWFTLSTKSLLSRSFDWITTRSFDRSFLHLCRVAVS